MQKRLLGMTMTAPYLAYGTIQPQLLLCLDSNQMDKLNDKQNVCFAPKNLQVQNRFLDEFLKHDLDALHLSKMGSIEV